MKSEKYIHNQRELKIPSDAERIVGGETGAVLYRFNGRVVKVAEQESALVEVRSNIIGYEGLHREGAGQLLPAGLEWCDTGAYAWIDMPDLGADMAQRDLMGQDLRPEYGVLAGAIVDLVDDTLRHDNEQQVGIETLQMQIAEWLAVLSSSYPELFNDKIITAFQHADSSRATSGSSSVMIQDFTPDNIFVCGDSVAFIDPWQQQTYRGSIIPSLAQYYTNAVEVREFPSAVQSADVLSNAIDAVATRLQLSNAQFAVQYEMGRTLQYLLSSFVRISIDPERSRQYAVEAARGIESIRVELEGLQ